MIGLGNILVRYTDGVYGGSDPQDRGKREEVCANDIAAKDICNALLDDYALKQDKALQANGDAASMDGKLC